MIDFLKFIPPLHPEGYRFVLIGLALTFCGFWIRIPLGYLGLALTLACALFFRHPNRVTPDRFPDAVVSAADGIVTQIQSMKPPECLGLLDAEVIRVSTFLSVFDVHVNRVPFSGKVVRAQYYPGKFLNASLDKSSDENERQCLTFEHEGVRVGVVQIAGLIARRIVCDLAQGQTGVLGVPFGIIRFGSRVDLYLPKSYEVLVKVGQRMVGGETLVALPKDSMPL